MCFKGGLHLTKLAWCIELDGLQVECSRSTDVDTKVDPTKLEVLFQEPSSLLISNDHIERVNFENPTLSKQPDLETILSTPKKKLNNCIMFILHHIVFYLMAADCNFISFNIFKFRFRDVASAVFR